MCRYPGCEWGPSTTSTRAKHEKGVHGKIFQKNSQNSQNSVPGPSHIQGDGPSPGSGQSGTMDTGFFILARGKDTGREYRGDVDLDIPRNLSPIVPNYVSSQADEASGSELSAPTSEPSHSFSGEDLSGAY